VKHSTAWESASIPVTAVTLGGMDSMRRGSMMAILGIRLGWRMGSLWPVRWLVKTETDVTSAPVPAVVGMAMTGTQPGTVLLPNR
jgi:hypothetical protein